MTTRKARAMLTAGHCREAPPPYAVADGDRRRSELKLDDGQMFASEQQSACEQTLPKSSQLYSGNEERKERASSNQITHREPPYSSNHFKQHVDQWNEQHSCTLNRPNGNRKRGSREGSQRDEFVRSLEARRSILSYLTIEPFAFLAILSLYIEFPAIQDLIYTKVCLQVVSDHGNLTNWHYQYAPQQLARLEQITTQAPNITHLQPVTLAPSGRIQSSDNAQITNQQQSNESTIGPSDHLICNRPNMRNIPLEVRREIIERDSLFWLKYQIVICSLCALSAPYWGGLSDKVGRVIPLNAPIVGSMLGNFISLVFGLLISMDSHTLFNLNWLYTGALIVGLTGGQGVLIMTSFSFLSDNTTTEERSKRVLVLETVIAVSHSVGFLLNRLIMSLGLSSLRQIWLNRHVVAFSACILLDLLCLVHSMLKLRHHKFHKFLNNFEREQQEAAAIGDSLTPSSVQTRNSPADTTCCRAKIRGCGSTNTSTSTLCGGEHNNGAAAIATISPIGHQSQLVAATCGGERSRELTLSTPDDFSGSVGRADQSNWTVWDTLITFKYYKQTYEAATKRREMRSIIMLLLLSSFISSMCLAALMSLLFIYLKGDPFNWPTSNYSTWNAENNITKGLALIALTVCLKFVTSWNIPDPLVAAVGFLSKALGLITIGLAQSSAMINWSLLAFVLSEYSMPPIRSLLSKLVVKEELGKIYSCIGMLQSICFIFANIAFYLVSFTMNQQHFFKTCFFAVAGVELTAVLIMISIYATIRKRVIIV